MDMKNVGYIFDDSMAMFEDFGGQNWYGPIQTLKSLNFERRTRPSESTSKMSNKS